MGGDDLANDDDYLVSVSEQWLSKSLDIDHGRATMQTDETLPSKKRGTTAADAVTDRAETNRTRRKRAKPLDIFHEAQFLAEFNIHQQADFLQRFLEEGTRPSGNDDNDNDDAIDSKANMVHVSYLQYASKESLIEKLKDSVSMKRLKNWNVKASPSVIIVCVSARRATAILQELSPLKIRIAKLFPKNAGVDEQANQLTSTALSIAIGTPHRLHALAEGPVPKIFANAQLVVIDRWVTTNHSTVLTLSDTGPYCKSLLLDHILPYCRSRNDLKIAFF